MCVLGNRAIWFQVRVIWFQFGFFGIESTAIMEIKRGHSKYAQSPHADKID